jgi:hypothetical protein
MLLSWIIKAIPRSLRTFLPFLVALGSLALIFSTLMGLFDPTTVDTDQLAFRLAVGVGVGLPAIAVFYLCQHLDDAKRHNKSESQMFTDYGSDSDLRVYKENRAPDVRR